MYLLSKIVSAGASALRSGALIAHATSLTLTITPTVIAAVQLSKQMQLRESLIVQEVLKKTGATSAISIQFYEVVRAERESSLRKGSQEDRINSKFSQSTAKSWTVISSQAETGTKTLASEKIHLEAEVRDSLKSFKSKEALRFRGTRSLLSDVRSTRSRPGSTSDASRKVSNSTSNLLKKSAQSFGATSQTISRALATLGSSLGLATSSTSQFAPNSGSASALSNSVNGAATSAASSSLASVGSSATSGSASFSATNAAQNSAAPVSTPAPQIAETHATHSVSPAITPLTPVVSPAPSPVTVPSPVASVPSPASAPWIRDASGLTPSSSSSHTAQIIPGTVYRIQSTCHASKVIGVLGSASIQEAPLELITNSPDDLSQEWQITQDSTGYYQFQVSHTRFMMDVRYADLSSGQKLIQWPGNGGLNQRFIATANADGSFSFQAAHSGMYVTGSVQDSSVLQSNAIGDCTQNFNLIPVASTLGLCLKNSTLSSLDAFTSSSSLQSYITTSSGSSNTLQFQISSMGVLTKIQNASPLYADSLSLGANQNFYISQSEEGVRIYKLTDSLHPAPGFSTQSLVDLGFDDKLSQYGKVSLALDLTSNGKILISAYSYQSSNFGFYPLAEVDPNSGDAVGSSLPSTGLPYCRFSRPLNNPQSSSGTRDSLNSQSGLDN